MILSAYNRLMQVPCTLVFVNKQLHIALAHSKSLPVNPPMAVSYSDPFHARSKSDCMNASRIRAGPFSILLDNLLYVGNKQL